MNRKRNLSGGKLVPQYVLSSFARDDVVFPFTVRKLCENPQIRGITSSVHQESCKEDVAGSFRPHAKLELMQDVNMSL
jgi:hypothetical protein